MICEVIDDFLNKSYFKELQEIIECESFLWLYKKNLTWSNKDNLDNMQNYGFDHWFYKDEGQVESPVGYLVKPLLLQIQDKIGCDKILRARADMVTWTKEPFLHEAHQDYTFPHKACVFYINKTDGDTVFYNVQKNEYNKDCEIKERVSPKPNRLVIFDGELMHSGHSPTKHKRRILINCNFMKQITWT